MSRLLTLLLITLTVPIACADEIDPEPPRTGQAIPGTWESVRVIGNGPATPVGLTLTFEKDRVVISYQGKATDKILTFKVDPRKNPAHIDLTEGQRIIKGIYKIDKDELHLCIVNDKRAKFDGKVAPVVVLKRQKK
jgi:uncharacterized protein (TIGR03067 family)